MCFECRDEKYLLLLMFKKGHDDIVYACLLARFSGINLIALNNIKVSDNEDVGPKARAVENHWNCVKAKW